MSGSPSTSSISPALVSQHRSRPLPAFPAPLPPSNLQSIRIEASASLPLLNLPSVSSPLSPPNGSQGRRPPWPLMVNARSSPSLFPLPCSIKPRPSSCVAPFTNTHASPRIPPPSHVSRGWSQKPPPPPVLPCRFANSVDLQDERALPGASPSRAAPPLPLPVAGDPLEPHRHRGPPPLMAAAGVCPHRLGRLLPFPLRPI
jgi:hypothetical protein